ncbi:MAG TPA: endonuclease III [Terracidiphilus sp.]|jgi:endonuclease-3
MPVKAAKKPANKSIAAKTTAPAKKSAPARKKSAVPAGATAVTRTRSLGGDRSPERVKEILKALDEAYPHAVCALNHGSPWELLVATILSAQCTDVRVNMVTPKLFERFPTPAAMAKAEIPALIELIRTTGFFNNKAKSLKGAAEAITSRFGGRVPESLEELITVPGAARKTANVVLGVSFGKAEGVVVDTHVFRISHRLDLAKGDTPQAVEQELMKILPHAKWIDFSHQIIHHGRQVCIARSPRCKDCNLETLCHSKDKTWWS